MCFTRETVVRWVTNDSRRGGPPYLYRPNNEGDDDRDDDGVERPRSERDGVHHPEYDDYQRDPATASQSHSTGVYSTARSTTSTPDSPLVVRMRCAQTLRTSRCTSSGTT
ncbi:hypothetical protein HFX_2037 [Haloferax mediterranei ATCC 33500]|uniref:Uncharacterized protein n=1 Tax=Haloferax mediterranei (strain ATCC 33500 / DSM 1411 / JCM 8866 / NBRC 14739 / NCIMB 2177 / R-4) TaxID=523841 RepID=I3R668_HALMT|nr:hypothetical protein HFX_2037 [Haloferax mediterranei ATCC 33500]